MADSSKTQCPPPYSPMPAPTGSDGVTVNMNQPAPQMQGQPMGYNPHVYNAGYDQPGDAYAQRPMQMMPPTNVQVTQVNAAPVVVMNNRGADLLIPSILVCFCCSPLFGILAIIFACMANSEFDAGNQVGGNKYNRYARISMLASVLITILVIVIYVILAFTVLAKESENLESLNDNGY